MAPLTAAMDAAVLPTPSSSFPALSCSQCPCSRLSFSHSFLSDPLSGFSSRLHLTRHGGLRSKQLQRRAGSTVLALGTFPELEDRETGESDSGNGNGRDSDDKPGESYNPRGGRYERDSEERPTRSYNRWEAGDRGSRGYVGRAGRDSDYVPSDYRVSRGRGYNGGGGRGREAGERSGRGYNGRFGGDSEERPPWSSDTRGREAGERPGRGYNGRFGRDSEERPPWSSDTRVGEGRRGGGAASKVRTVRKKEGPSVPRGAKAPKNLILKPPMDDTKMAERLLASPQLTLKTFPLLSACLPSAPLRKSDTVWIDENMLELKDALGYPLEGMENPGEGSPLVHLETLLYLAFQHEGTVRYKKAFYVRNGHTRLAFLGQQVVEMALTELLLQMFPKETTGCTRDRTYLLTGKKFLPEWIKAASMDRLIFPEAEDIDRLKRKDREPPIKSTFSALMGALYLTMGMGEVYRVLFEVFGMDPYAKACQPKPRSRLDDIDFVSPELERKLSWQDIAFYEPPADSLFAEPRLFRACVPPGMHRFRGSLWEDESLGYVKKVLGYPRPPSPRDTKEALKARNLELDLGLQLCFLHPSKFKFEHPRFCNERLELLGSRVMDVIMAEKLLMKHLDGPGEWLGVKHRRLLMNRVCGRLLRDKKLGRHVVYSDERILVFERCRRLRNLTTSGVQQAIHGLGYVVYGRPEVRRLMFDVFDTEAGPQEQRLLPAPYRPTTLVPPAGYQSSRSGTQSPQFRYPPNYQTQFRSNFPSSPFYRPPPPASDQTATSDQTAKQADE